MHKVIVIGAGEVGQHIARRLSAEGHEVTVVDSDEARVEAVAPQLDALVIAGNGASPKLLADIGAGDADLLLAVTQSDEANLIATLAAHQLGARRTVARVRDAEFFGSDAGFARDRLGIDFVIHPERVTADDIADAIGLPGAVAVEFFGDGRVAVAESILTERSSLVGIPLSQRPIVRPQFIMGVVSGGHARLAAPDDRLAVGDRVLVAAARADIAAVVADVAGQAPRVRDVVIFGAGRVGLPLALRLEADRKAVVTVMERDAARARYVAERLTRTTVVHEDGVSKEQFLAHGIDRAGAFVACAGDDRHNLLAARYAKELGAGLCLAVVSREEYMPLVAGLGIDAAFSPRLVTADEILRFIRGEQVRAMHLLFSGAEVLEVNVDAGCKMDGRPVHGSGLPRGCHIAAIVRDEHILFPREQQRISAGDQVILFGVGDSCVDVERLFDA